MLYAFTKLTQSCDVEIFDPWATNDHPLGFGGCVNNETGTFAGIAAMKAANPDLKALVSVGGWSLSKFFSSCAANPSQRQKIALQLADFLQAQNWDGADIDWEYPEVPGMSDNQVSDDDGENYILLLEDIRAQLNQRFDSNPQSAQYKLLTIASGMGPSVLNSLSRDRPSTPGQSRMSGICNALDLVNVMTYDMAGPWQ